MWVVRCLIGLLVIPQKGSWLAQRCPMHEVRQSQVVWFGTNCPSLVFRFLYNSNVFASNRKKTFENIFAAAGLDYGEKRFFFLPAMFFLPFLEQRGIIGAYSLLSYLKSSYIAPKPNSFSHVVPLG